jgi:hypothetical protein
VLFAQGHSQTVVHLAGIIDTNHHIQLTFEIGSCYYFAQVGFKPRSSCVQSSWDYRCASSRLGIFPFLKS